MLSIVVPAGTKAWVALPFWIRLYRSKQHCPPEEFHTRLRRMKNGGEHDVFVSDRVRDELARLVGDQTSGPVFLARGGRRITMRQVQRRLAEWLAKAGIEGRFSPHSLRHTFATELYRRTRDVGLVQAALGHASITSTMIYARVDEQRLREAVGAA